MAYCSSPHSPRTRTQVQVVRMNLEGKVKEKEKEKEKKKDHHRFLELIEELNELLERQQRRLEDKRPTVV